MLGLLTAGASAAASIVYLAHKGNAKANWFSICQQFNSFCERISGSLIGSFGGIVVFILLILLSAVALSRRWYIKLRSSYNISIYYASVCSIINACTRLHLVCLWVQEWIMYQWIWFACYPINFYLSSVLNAVYLSILKKMCSVFHLLISLGLKLNFITVAISSYLQFAS